MKQLLFVLLTGVMILLSAPRTVHAQQIVAGAKIGASFSSLSGDDDFDHDSTFPRFGPDFNGITSFVGGVYARILFGYFGGQIEALYVTKGASLDFGGDDDVDLKIDYVEIPLFAVASFRYFRVAPFFMVGPAFAIQVRCRTEFFLDDINQEFDCDDIEAATRIFSIENVDIGAAIGAGVLISVGPGAALLEARYTHGLTDINDTEFDDNSIRNRSGYLMAGYAFPIRSR